MQLWSKLRIRTGSTRHAGHTALASQGPCWGPVKLITDIMLHRAWIPTGWFGRSEDSDGRGNPGPSFKWQLGQDVHRPLQVRRHVQYGLAGLRDELRPRGTHQAFTHESYTRAYCVFAVERLSHPPSTLCRLEYFTPDPRYGVSFIPSSNSIAQRQNRIKAWGCAVVRCQQAFFFAEVALHLFYYSFFILL